MAKAVDNANSLMQPHAMAEASGRGQGLVRLREEVTATAIIPIATSDERMHAAPTGTAIARSHQGEDTQINMDQEAADSLKTPEQKATWKRFKSSLALWA